MLESTARLCQKLRLIYVRYSFLFMPETISRLCQELRLVHMPCTCLMHGTCTCHMYGTCTCLMHGICTCLMHATCTCLMHGTCLKEFVDEFIDLRIIDCYNEIKISFMNCRQQPERWNSSDNFCESPHL